MTPTPIVAGPMPATAPDVVVVQRSPAPQVRRINGIPLVERRPDGAAVYYVPAEWRFKAPAGKPAWHTPRRHERRANRRQALSLGKQ